MNRSVFATYTDSERKEFQHPHIGFASPVEEVTSPMPLFRITLLVCLLPSLIQAESVKTLPWPDGEKLVYLIQWGPLEAAEAIFSARIDPQKEDTQHFELFLRSRGPVEAFFPIRSRFASLTQLRPWRSLEYIQDRSEGGNIRNRKTIPDYSVKLGRFFPAPGKPEEPFELPDGPAEDFGSMLYHVRAHPWKAGESLQWNVLENKEPLFAKMTCNRIDQIQLEDEKPRRLIEILGEPIGASRRHQGWMKLWMTDDSRRIPVMAKLKFQYGTFDILLIRGGGPGIDWMPEGEPVPVFADTDHPQTP